MKSLILNTIPKTGTHTMLYLFGYLGGINMYFEHFELQFSHRLYQMLEHAKEHRDELIFVQTARSSGPTVISNTADAHDPDANYEYLLECYTMREEMRRAGYPCDYFFPIEADVDGKTEVANIIFDACGIDPPAEAREFMKTWPRLHAAGQDDTRGFGDEWPEFRPTLHNRFRTLFDSMNYPHYERTSPCTK